VKDFPRPKTVKVKIFGTEHELHRLTRQDVWDLVGVVMETLNDTISQMVNSGVGAADAVKTAISSGGPALSFLLQTSFPTFQEWKSLPVKYEIELLDLIWTENDMEGIIKDFLSLMGKVAKAGQKIATLQKS
jgi:hypothetical protein